MSPSLQTRPDNISGLPILNITTVPQQVPVKDGVTIMNVGTSVVILSTDAIANASNSFQLAINGALPIPGNTGPLWASVASGSGQVVVINREYNITNPLVQVTGPNVDTLVNGVTISPVSPLVVPTLSKYTGVIVQYGSRVGGTDALLAQVVNATTGPGFNMQSSGTFVNATGTTVGITKMATVPIDNNVGDQLRISFVGGNVATSLQVWVYGLISRRVPVRGDGRPVPIGAIVAGNTLGASNGPVNIIAAQLSPIRVLLKEIFLDNGTATATISINATINGVLAVLAEIRNGVNVYNQKWDDGLLLDANTALTLQGGGTPTGIANAIYDLVL